MRKRLHLLWFQMMSKHLTYQICVMIATVSMLLSTVVLHHHHFNQICFVEERCAIDGNLNDEHTEHHGNEQEGCRIHQMHHFLINAKEVKSIKKHIADGNLVLVALASLSDNTFFSVSLSIARWQEKLVPLSQKAFLKRYRRGPPVLS